MIYILAFITGLAGSLHCVGMCGPIAMIIGQIHQSKAGFWLPVFMHQLGRIITYIFLGALIGGAGSHIQTGAWQQWLSLTSGTLILLLIWMPGWMHRFKWIYIEKLVGEVKTILGKSIKGHPIVSPIMTGILNGFLPCGFLYIGLAGSLAVNSSLNGGMYMLVFGLGTIPLMLFAATGPRLFPTSWRVNASKIAPYIFTCVAVLFILRGMNLGIAYISPSISETPYAIESVKCHK